MASQLAKELKIYQNFHKNKTNIWIHKICVPVILVTTLSFFQFELGSTTIKFAHLVSIILNAFYLSLNMIGGSIFTVIFLLINATLDNNYLPWGVKTNIFLFIMSWGLQIWGHNKFEKNKPAIFTNLLQSLVLAPFFVMFEWLFDLGFYQDLQFDLKGY